MSFTILQKPTIDAENSAGIQPFLQISLLGEFALRHDDLVLSLDTTSHQGLLAYLIIHAQHVHSRQKLAFRFWPDSSETQARTNLRKALHYLRQTLPGAQRFLIIERQSVQWRSNAPCAVDVWDFTTAIIRSRQTNSPAGQQACFQQAIAAYYGDFLPGFYDDWVLSKREQFRQQYLDTMEKSLILHENERHYGEAISLARKMLREDPLHEAAYRRLMRLQALDGNIAGALRTYHSCCTHLQHELGVDPTPATQETYEGLLRVQAPRSPLVLARLPLVARKEVWQRLLAAWKQRSLERPGVLLLSGEAGIGKTRLAEEMLEWAERQGIVVLTAVCYPSEKQLAYAPVAKWLRSENLQPFLGRLDKHSLLECSRLLPEINQQFPDLPPPSPLTESWQRHYLFSALAQSVIQLRQPFLLFIDDLHCCDQDSLDWLLFLLNHDPQARFLLLGTARSGEITEDHPLIPWQQQLDRDGRLTKISLQRLDAESSAKLAGHVYGKELDNDQAARLYTETEGNPLFIVEMARASLSAEQDNFQSSTLPPKVQAVIESRLRALSPPAQELAQLAAVIGHSFTFTLLKNACIHDQESVIRSLDELWQRRIVREGAVDSYEFSHDKIRQGAYESLGPARRQLLHQRVWQALDTLFTDNLDQVSGQIAAHCEASGNYLEAILYYHRAARAAQAIFANQDAVHCLQCAVGLFALVEANTKQQCEIYEDLGDVLKTIGHYEEAEAALTAAVSFTVEPLSLSQLHQSMAGVHEVQRHFDRAHQSLDAAEQALHLAAQDPADTWWHEWLNIRLKRLDLYYFTNQIGMMHSLGEEIKSILDDYGSAMQKAYYYRSLSRFGFRRERYAVSDATVVHAEAAYAAANDTDQVGLQAATRFALAFAYLWYGWRGDLDKAVYHLQGTLELAEEMGDVLIRTRCLNYLALLHRRRGDVRKVSELLPIALLAAKEGDLQEYYATVDANTSWLKWNEGDLSAAKVHGKHALISWQTSPIVFPLQWMALWPLIDIALIQDELKDAANYTQILLRPEMSRLPEELITLLQTAVDAYENRDIETSAACLQKSLQYARDLRQL